MKKNLSKASALLAMALCAEIAWAQTYTYRTESFEDDSFATAAATVSAPTGEWTLNRNVSSTDQAQDGSKSLYFAKKTGVTLPELAEGAGTLIYYAYSQNREAHVATSTDGTTWTDVEVYKESATGWFKHIVDINDPAVRFVRITTTSNSQFYIDNLLLTKPDGTDGDGNTVVCNLPIPYFTNTFEHSQFPQDKTQASTEKRYNVEGQGEWIYLNAYKNTNEAYINDGSGRSLRMMKSGSYVITPVLGQGTTRITFDEGRGAKRLYLYTSADAGESWQLLRVITTEKSNEIVISDRNVNRVKIANEASDTKGDCDLDNITVMAFPEGTPATVGTGAVDGITSSSATASGSISDLGDKSLIEAGFCWAAGREPGYADNHVAAQTDGNSFSATLAGLPAETVVNIRSYALTMAGIAYGQTVSITTLPPSVPFITSGSLEADNYSDEVHLFYNLTSTITDNGGVDITEAGVVFATEGTASLDNGERLKGYIFDGSFTVSLPLMPETSYSVRAYAVNSIGAGYGPELTITTGKISIPDYPHNVYYCDPEGNDDTADGSEAAPFRSLQKAVDKAVAGDVIYMNAGTYRYNTRINIPNIGAPNSGMIRIESRGGRAVLDFAGQGLGDANQGIRITGSYWHIYGLDIINAGDNGMLIERNKPTGGTYADIAARTEEGHDNIIENCSFVRNMDTGLQMKNLATFNRVVNCDAYYNADPDHGNADGFAVKISHGTGNYFYGCRAWQNSDDGWDQFIKQDGGFPDDITTTLEYCWAFSNGYLETGAAGKGNGNGFKMGSNQGRNNVILNRCLAFNNLNKGFDQNHNTGNMILNNCAAFATADGANKSRYSYRLDEPVAQGHEIRLTNCVSVCDGDDRKTVSYAISDITGTIVSSDLYTLPEDYVSVSADEMTAPRAEDGTLPATNFLRPAPQSDKFVDKGIEVAPYEGESRHAVGIQFAGAAPDLGYYESGMESGISVPELSHTAAGSKLHAAVSRSGLLILSVEGATDDSRFDLRIFDITGRTLASVPFTSHTVSITPDAIPGTILIVNVCGTDFDESVKVRMTAR